MRTFSLTMVLATVCACGFDPVEEGLLTTQQLQQQQTLAGVYEYGPMVGKALLPADDSIAYPTSRLARLELKDDGTFTMTFGSGCVIDFGDGTWTQSGAGAALTLTTYSSWTDAQGARLSVATVYVAPAEGGLSVTGVGSAGAFAQTWDRR